MDHTELPWLHDEQREDAIALELGELERGPPAEQHKSSPKFAVSGVDFRRRFTTSVAGPSRLSVTAWFSGIARREGTAMAQGSLLECAGSLPPGPQSITRTLRILVHRCCASVRFQNCPLAYRLWGGGACADDQVR